jgi:hypothetical protein
MSTRRAGCDREETMGTLIFLCPATGDEVSTGLEMDLPALERLELGKVSTLSPAAPNGWD